MGTNNQTNMVFRSILVAIALIASAHAVPTPNDIVPETKFVEAAATSAHASAKQIVTEMIQAGSDWTACSELANATRDEVEDNVESKQDMLDNLDKGCGCAALGQDEVTRTVNEMNAALNAVTDAETALETATNAQVQLSSQSFQFLQSGECGWIMTDSSYQTAHVTYTTAVTTLATARTTYTLSVTAHTEAVTEAASLKLECECATQSEQAVAWAEAHHIDCVVDHIAEADCSFGPAPGLTQPTLCDDIESVSCAAESGSAAPVAAESGSAAAPVAAESGSTESDPIYHQQSSEMRQIISTHFAGLDAGHSFVDLPAIRSKTKDKTPDQLCMTLDYTAGNPGLREILKTVGIDEYCNPETGTMKDDQSCKAIAAAEKAFGALAQKFPQGPRFRNYLPVDWSAKPNAPADQLYSTCTAGSLSGLVVPPDGSPPTAQFTATGGNGCNHYGLCNIIVTALTQSNEQKRTGTCGAQAVFDAVASIRPARAIKIATEILWTGSFGEKMPMSPCRYIQDQMPGLIPWKKGYPGCPKDGEPGASGRRCAAAACTGNANDCAAATGSAYQLPGLSYMLSQAFLSAYYHKLTGSCPVDPKDQHLQPVFGATTRSAEIEHAQSTYPSALLDLCKGLIGNGVKCNFETNDAACPRHARDKGNCERLKYLTTFPSVSVNEIMEVLKITDPAGNQVLAAIAASSLDATAKKRVTRFFQDVYAASGLPNPMAHPCANHGCDSFVAWSTFPVATQTNLDAACAAQTAVVNIQSLGVEFARM